jgi:hypothetical protein
MISGFYWYTADGQILDAHQDKKGALSISPTILVLPGKHGVSHSSLILPPEVATVWISTVSFFTPSKWRVTCGSPGTRVEIERLDFYDPLNWQPLLLGGPIARADPGHQETPKPPSLSLANSSRAPSLSLANSSRATCYGHVSRSGSPLRSGALGLAHASLLAPSRLPKEAAPLVGGVRVERDHNVLSRRCLRLCAPDRRDTKPRGAAHATRASCAPPTSKASVSVE